MDNLYRYERIIKKFEELYGDLENLKTNNDNLHTRVFYTDIKLFRNNHGFKLLSMELPVLECQLDNGNYVLATTNSLFSIYDNIKYEMKYSDFSKNDKKYFSKNGQIAEGKTRVFKYYLKDGNEFLYEIDSLYPADIVHNRLVLSMQFGKYDSPTAPSV
ncbi:hypothetical protein [Aquimarina spinulae]|uniref:hypothetical protein n=1 Tax=Aquimarina spinulae TaxID=1192023 RepID=UPI000D54E682|nr:hypothetical protein [Aquimarina spinulae]